VRLYAERRSSDPVEDCLWFFAGRVDVVLDGGGDNADELAMKAAATGYPSERVLAVLHG